MSTIVPAMTKTSPPPIAKSTRYFSWGRYPQVECEKVFQVCWNDQVEGVLRNAQNRSLLPYGLGRSYGDVCLNEGRSLIDCSRLDRFIAADFEHGWLRCEGGTSLGQILELTVPRGWFLPVLPGTKHVTLGGAIANDVHGKNHHRAGSFGCQVRKIALYRSEVGVVVCSREENPELFRATVGGLGLTGVILWAEIELKPVQGRNIEVETLPFDSLSDFLTITENSDLTHEYTVAWIDCFFKKSVRGVFFRGNHSGVSGHAGRRGVALKVPFSLPGWLLNPITIKTFNSVYRLRQRCKSRNSIIDYAQFFFPLDSIRHWNLAYGRRGLIQYQCVVPTNSRDAIEELLRTISNTRTGSFLAVLKQFGSYQSPGLLSFPRPGLTLAVDFPMHGESTLRFLETLDTIVLKAGGALYPAKDARMSREMFTASFPNWHQMRSYVDGKFSSSFWRRVAEGISCRN